VLTKQLVGAIDEVNAHDDTVAVHRMSIDLGRVDGEVVARL
jgi:hypothetical protein